MDVIAALVILLIHFLWGRRLRLALVLGLPVTLEVPFLASMVSPYSLAHWLNFVPIMAGMLIHELYEASEKPHDLRALLTAASAEAEKLRAQNKELKEFPRARRHHP